MNDTAWRERLVAAAADHRAGRLDDAEPVYRAVLQQMPGQADALHLLGVLNHQRGRDDEAVGFIQRAIAVEAGVADFYNNLGVSLGALQRLAEAEASFRQALRLQSAFGAALCNLGDVLVRQGRIDEALYCHHRAVATEPDNAEFHYNLGLALKEKGALDAAAGAYEKAIALRPAYGSAHNNLGVVRFDQGRYEEADVHYERALWLDPTNAQAHYNLGKLRHIQGRFGEEMACYRQALDINKLFAAAHDNLLMVMNYDPAATVADLAEAHREFGRRHDRPAATIAPHGNVRSAERRLRIGYVSPDFRGHSCAFFAAPLFVAHDRSVFETFAYAELRKPDVITDRFKATADHWRETARHSDDAVAAMVRDDKIDILVDLAGHTADNRLGVFARKPAPVQVTWLGYPGSTGLRAIDYRLTDAVADPPEADAHAVEALVRLPGGFLCYEAPADSPAVAPLAAATAKSMTFGCFNNVAKINADVAGVWAKILQAVPGSRLVIKGFHLDRDDARSRFERLFSAAGVSPGRIEIRPPFADARAHLAAYSDIDIALDPFPYNGATTTCEALWMGVPVVTLLGNRHAARVGASLLTSAGLPGLIASSPADYVAKAASLAGNVDRLAALRASLRERMRASRLTDAAGFARSVENAYRTLWRRWCAAAD